MSVESVLLQFLKELIRKKCNRPAMVKWSAYTEERPKLLKNDFPFEKVKVLSTGNIPVFDWLAIATGNFGVRHGFDLVEQQGTFPCSGPGP